MPLVKLPSLDIFNDTYPGRFPAYWEIKHWQDLVEIAQFSTGRFSEPLAFSLRAWRYLDGRKLEFDLVHDNQCLGYGMLGHRPAAARPRDAAPPDHDGPGASRSRTPPNARKR